MRLTPELIKTLETIVGGDAVLTGANDLAVYGVDGTTHCKGEPEAVVFPSTAEDISQIMALSDAHEIPVTVRGAGTSLSGGPVPVAGGHCAVHHPHEPYPFHRPGKFHGQDGSGCGAERPEPGPGQRKDVFSAGSAEFSGPPPSVGAYRRMPAVPMR